MCMRNHDLRMRKREPEKFHFPLRLPAHQWAEQPREPARVDPPSQAFLDACLWVISDTPSASADADAPPLAGGSR